MSDEKKPPGRPSGRTHTARSVTIPSDIDAEIRQIAAERKVAFSAVVVEALQAFLKRHRRRQ